MPLGNTHYGSFAKRPSDGRRAPPPRQISPSTSALPSGGIMGGSQVTSPPAQSLPLPGAPPGHLRRGGHGDAGGVNVLAHLRMAASALSNNQESDFDVHIVNSFRKMGKDVDYGHSAPQARVERKAELHDTIESAFSVAISSVVSKTMTQRERPVQGMKAKGMDPPVAAEADFPDIETAPLVDILEWAKQQDLETRGITLEPITPGSARTRGSRSLVGYPVDGSPVSLSPRGGGGRATPPGELPEDVEESASLPLAEPSFASRLYACWTGTCGIQKENALFLTALRKGGISIPDNILDPASHSILVTPVWGVDGGIAERAVGSGDSEAEVINHACARDICLWKLRCMLLYFRPGPVGSISSTVFSGFSIERGVLSWQHSCSESSPWVSYSSDDSQTIETEFQQAGDSASLQIMTSRGVEVFDFGKMFSKERVRRGSRTVDGASSRIRRIFLPPRHTSCDIRYYWRRVRQLLQEKKCHEDKNMVFGGTNIDVGAMRGTSAQAVDKVFEHTADRQWLVGKETDARTQIALTEQDYRNESCLTFLCDLEMSRRCEVLQRESKIRLVYWTIEVEHKSVTSERIKKAAEAKVRKEVWESRLMQKRQIRERDRRTRITDTGGRRAVSDYSKAPFTDRFLMMLETQRKRHQESEGFEGDTGVAEPAEGPCPYCPSEAAHRSSHWMWLGAPPSVPRPPTSTRISTALVPASCFGIVPVKRRIMPSRQPYIY